MQANVYKLDSTVKKSIDLPVVFDTQFRKDIVMRALLSEQSKKYQPQGRYPLAGLQTTATYMGAYGTYRTLRHVGRAIRPRQKLAAGAMGDVRRIPSATKGRRAHPQKTNKITAEQINRKEYEKAISMAIAATSNKKLVQENYKYEKIQLPVVVDSEIEKINKSRELVKVLNALGFSEVLDDSHKPAKRKGLRRLSRQRHFKSGAVIIAKDISKLHYAGRNIPGIDVIGVESMTVGKLAPGANPRIAIWSESAISDIEKGISSSGMNR